MRVVGMGMEMGMAPEMGMFLMAGGDDDIEGDDGDYVDAVDDADR